MRTARGSGRSVRGRRIVWRLAVLGGVVLPGAGCVSDLPPPDPDEHRAAALAWQTQRREELSRPDGWLSVVGLFWLDEGVSTFGTDASDAVVFPGEAPGHIGVFVRDGGTVRMEVAPGVAVLHAGEPVTSLVLTPDVEGDPAIAELGRLRWFLIQREDQIGIRLKDTANPAIAAFDGVDAYPIDVAWSLAARFDRYPTPRTVEVPNVLGMITHEPSPGAVVFRLDGTTYRLTVTGDPDDDEYFIVFGDRTNGEETYGGGRFLEVKAPDAEGRTYIDFNRAYNPPCVFTAFATCPLPRPEDRLPVRIEAGEKMYVGAGHAAVQGR